jgi:hypothetical protein
MRVEQAAQRAQLTPLDRVRICLEPGVDHDARVRTGGIPAGVAVVERDRRPRRFLGQCTAEQLIAGALGAGRAQQLSRDRGTSGAVEACEILRRDRQPE